MKITIQCESIYELLELMSAIENSHSSQVHVDEQNLDSLLREKTREPEYLDPQDR